MPEFGENLAFAKVLNLARKDAQVLDALKLGDRSLVEAYPGLSTRERKFLSALNWSEVELKVTDDDIINFSPVAAGSVCESKVATEVAERKCYKL